MTATNHAVTGAVIAAGLKRPELAIPLAFISHFVIDMIPHFEARDLPPNFSKLFIAADVLISVIWIILLTVFASVEVPAWLIFVCSAVAVSPDFMWVFRYLRIKDLDKVFTEPMSRIARLHLNIQFSETLKGIMVEAVWLALMVSLLIKLS